MKTVFTRNDGGISILNMIEGTDITREIAKWSEEDQKAIVSYREMPDVAIPEDKSFRNAWCDVTPEEIIDIDMVKAREIHRNKLRSLRVPLLKALDVEYQKADEVNDIAEKAKIALKKRALRDVTADPAIEAAMTPEELKAVLPAALIKR